MRWMLLLVLCLAAPSRAEDSEFQPQWTADCMFGGTGFSIRFSSRSGQADQDDQTVTLLRGGKASALPVEPALFESIEFASDAGSHCHGIGAFDWPNHRLLLLVARNNRPSDDEVLALVIDPETGRLVGKAVVLGTLWPQAMVLRHGSGLKLLLERSWHVNISDGGEFAAPDWMVLRDEQGRLVHEWANEDK